MNRDEIQQIVRAISMTVGQILLDCQEGRSLLTKEEIRLIQELGLAAVEVDLEFQMGPAPVVS